jgi:NAD(P)-dependent dehydrogenase (short-subunit alcohol dehydrogenase family)
MFGGMYTAAKASPIAMTLTLAIEWESTRIKVHAALQLEEFYIAHQ